MFFYVDESGHTGKNLFDPSQPILYYGLLSSKVNLDLVAPSYLKALKKKFNVERLHGVDLGEEKLSILAGTILEIHKKYGLTFDVYRVVKADYALIAFFDQVFDQGVNAAVSWPTYWTPLRYAMILKLADFFDEEILKIAWSARIELDSKKAEKQLIAVCQIIKDRVSYCSDERLKQLVTDALQWVIDNPSAIQYNVVSREDLLQTLPNIIGFQYVIFGIASRLIKKNKTASKIVVDQQIEFNKAQQTLADLYLKFPKDTVIPMGIGFPEMNLKGIPEIPIVFNSGRNSAGLELVDIFLWIIKRSFEGKELPSSILSLIRSQLYRGSTRELSLEAIYDNWYKWFTSRHNVSEVDLKLAKEMMDSEEIRRLKSIKKV